ncbi:MAG: hypothetical protein UW04_C0030G0002 [Parcubacteria group bacterium GW2011_GWB1_43_8]|nr:MAG: hypothetical protein UW04_C0030G0002 [Parcubacteria group bacterium GW2011_GWB1_43_8]
MVKVKIVTLFLSFLFVLGTVTVNVKAEQTPEFSVSFRSSDSLSSQKYFSEQSEQDNGTNTVSLIVYNAMVNFLKDDDGDEYCSKLTAKFDLDASKRVNYYAISYLNLNGSNGYGYDWFMINSSDVYTLEEGYSPEEGILYLDMEVFGYGRLMKVSVKVEIYYEGGGLAYTFGPDDDPDLKDIMLESNDYDGKGDPFANPAVTPTPTLCDPENISVNPTDLTLARKTSEDVTVTITDTDGCVVEGETVTATINFAGRNRISISPSSAITDENGQTTFTITAMKKGNSKVTFKAGDVKKSIVVKVK